MDRLSFKFGFPNWIQTQENILKPHIDLVDGSYELFTWAHVVFRQLENTVLDHNDGQFSRAMEWLMFFFRPPLPSMVF